MISTYSGNTEKWVQNVGSNPDAQLRLFCFAYAGGSASVFRSWANQLSPLVEVCPIQLPGRENRYKEPAFINFAELIDQLKQVLQPYLNLPCAFFGHSLGGLIAFELARKLSRNPLLAGRLEQLIVSGVRSPQYGTTEANTYKLPQAEFVEKLRQMGGTPEEILNNAELLDLILPIVRADFQLLANYNYQPGPALNCPITVFGGEQDAKVSRVHLEGWADHTTQPILINMFPGGHFFINSHKSLVLQTLNQQFGTLNSLVSF